MKTKRKIIIIVTVLVVLLIGATIAGFVIYQMNQQKQFEKNQKIFAQEILVPDRIVYKQEEKYYEFLPGEGAYQQILNSIGQKIDTYEEEAINQEGIDQIHQEESFLELDYKKASKNYILTLNKDQNQFIKLLDNGGQILDKETEKVKDLQKILHDKIEGKKSYKLEYKEYMSENRVDSMAYKYLEQFKKINNNIYQVKIENEKDYEIYKAICNIQLKEELPENIWENNVVILTLSVPRDIQVRVTPGNIRYTYDNKVNNIEYTVHLLVISKIVNTDCIYNTDNTQIEEQAAYQEKLEEQNKAVENLNTDIYENKNENTNTNKQKSNDKTKKETSKTDKITLEKAKEIAADGFKEAERIAGVYDKDTEEYKIEEVYANNFFTRKGTETDKVYNDKKITAYVFTRYDDMLNGVSVYIDAYTGKITGGRAFGD